jgi:tRNA A-37 threonylcarbamoyl transferase component Bud32
MSKPKKDFSVNDLAERQVILSDNQQRILDAISDLTASVNGLGIDLSRLKYEVDDTRSKADEIYSFLEQLSLRD